MNIWCGILKTGYLFSCVGPLFVQQFFHLYSSGLIQFQYINYTIQNKIVQASPPIWTFEWRSAHAPKWRHGSLKATEHELELLLFTMEDVTHKNIEVNIQNIWHNIYLVGNRILDHRPPMIQHLHLRFCQQKDVVRIPSNNWPPQRDRFPRIHILPWTGSSSSAPPMPDREGYRLAAFDPDLLVLIWCE